jgi:hypothetical protein
MFPGERLSETHDLGEAVSLSRLCNTSEAGETILSLSLYETRTNGLANGSMAAAAWSVECEP